METTALRCQRPAMRTYQSVVKKMTTGRSFLILNPDEYLADELKGNVNEAVCRMARRSCVVGSSTSCALFHWPEHLMS